MKYISKNLRNFYKNERLIFIFTIICIFFSAFVLNFSFGIFHEYQQRMLDNIYGINELQVQLGKSLFINISKSECMNAVEALDSGVKNELRSIVINGHYPKDDQTFPYVFNFIFRFQNDKITNVSEIYSNLVNSGLWVTGDYFTELEYENAELVAIVGDHKMIKDAGLENYAYCEQDGYVYVDGKKYKCIGIQSATYTPWIPFTTVENDFIVDDITFCSNDVMSKKEYIVITDTMKDYFGDLVDIPDYPIPDIDTQRLYKNILIICILIAITTALIYIVIYQYVLYQRKRTLAICRICGLTWKQAYEMYMVECMLMAIICYIGATCIFHYVCLPWLITLYTYIEESYSIISYGKLAILYFVIIFVMLRIMLFSRIKVRILDAT